MTREKKSEFKFISEEDAQDIKTFDFDTLIKELTFQYEKIGEIDEAKKNDDDLKRIKEELREANMEYREAVGRCSEKIKVIVDQIGKLGMTLNKSKE